MKSILTKDWMSQVAIGGYMKCAIHTSSPLRHQFRTAPLSLAVLFLLLSLTSCITDSIDEMIHQIEMTRDAITEESTAWRGELPKLVNNLSGMESQVSADTKGILADTTNQIQNLSVQTIQFSDAKAQDLIARSGTEFRCNADFVKEGTVQQLQYLIDDLKQWKKNKTHQGPKPMHKVCTINPAVLALYPGGGDKTWLIDSSNMSEKNIVEVFGYNFWADGLPTLQLQDASGQLLRNLSLRAAYVTHYQINLDFSNETFPDVKGGARVVLRWPDGEDPNTISLTMRPPAQLRISDPVVNPSQPVMDRDPVTLKVTITNVGGSRMNAFVVTWQPDPKDLKVFPVTGKPLDPGASTDILLGGYLYTRKGEIPSQVFLSNGDDMMSFNVSVQPSSPAPEPAYAFIASAQYPYRCIDVNGLPGRHNGASIQLGYCEFGDSSSDQRWRLTDDGYFQNKFGRCIDVRGTPGVHAHAFLQLWDCESSDSTSDQVWEITADGFIKNRYGRCIGPTQDPNYQGYNYYQDLLAIEDCQFGNPDSSQRWKLVPDKDPEWKPDDDLEWNTDRPGGDYDSFGIDTVDPRVCRDKCLQDARCKAWTYVKPAASQGKPVCWLKSSVPLPQDDYCCVSGVVN